MTDQRVNDIRVRCRLNILRLYPAHRQAALTDRTDFNAWKAANVAHMQNLIDSGTDDIDEGWPDPAAWERVDASEDPLERTLTNLEKAQEALKPAPVSDEPPTSIADLFQPDKPLAPQARALRELWLQIGHQIQRGEAKADEIRKHERLSSELEFINRHAFDGV